MFELELLLLVLLVIVCTPIDKRRDCQQFFTYKDVLQVVHFRGRNLAVSRKNGRLKYVESMSVSRLVLTQKWAKFGCFCVTNAVSDHLTQTDTSTTETIMWVVIFKIYKKIFNGSDTEFWRTGLNLSVSKHLCQAMTPLY